METEYGSSVFLYIKFQNLHEVAPYSIQNGYGKGKVVRN
jgi:hypothetical protein